MKDSVREILANGLVASWFEREDYYQYLTPAQKKTYLDEADFLVSYLKSHGLTIEADWSTDMESAPKGELILARTKDRTYHTVYWDGYGGGTWWIAGTTLNVTPAAWRPITTPQEVEG